MLQYVEDCDRNNHHSKTQDNNAPNNNEKRKKKRGYATTATEAGPSVAVAEDLRDSDVQTSILAIDQAKIDSIKPTAPLKSTSQYKKGSYKIERILQHRGGPSNREYLVNWHPSWVKGADIPTSAAREYEDYLRNKDSTSTTSGAIISQYSPIINGSRRCLGQFGRKRPDQPPCPYGGMIPVSAHRPCCLKCHRERKGLHGHASCSRQSTNQDDKNGEEKQFNNYNVLHERETEAQRSVMGLLFCDVGVEEAAVDVDALIPETERQMLDEFNYTITGSQDEDNFSITWTNAFDDLHDDLEAADFTANEQVLGLRSWPQPVEDCRQREEQRQLETLLNDLFEFDNE